MSSVARRFSRAAQTYDRGASLHRHVAARLVEMMPEPETLEKGRLLEVGCGTGVLSDVLRRRYPLASFCLLDAAEEMVACVRARFGNTSRLQCFVGDVREFSDSQPFDWIFSSSALHWAIPLEQTFVQLRRNLTTEGGVSVALMVDGTLRELHALRRQVAPAKVPPARLPTGEAVLSAVRQAGFTVVASDEESIQAGYHNAEDFLRTLHAQGLTGGEVSRATLPLSRKELASLQSLYDREFCAESGGVFATFQVLYLKATL